MITVPISADPGVTLIPKAKLPETALGFARLIYVPGISDCLSNRYETET